MAVAGSKAAFVALIALLFCMAATASEQVAPMPNPPSVRGTWSLGAPMAEARALLGFSFVNDTQQIAPGLGGFLAVGGTESAGDSLASVEVYYAYSGGWRPQADLISPRTALATASIYQTLFALGGLDGSGAPMANASAYVPISNGEWEAIADMPDPRAFAGADAYNDKVYVIGGENASGVAGKVLIYDTSVGEWSTGASMAIPRRELAVTAMGSYIYAIGGTGADGMASSECEVYDTVRDSWAYCPSLPYSATGLGATAIDEVIVVAGGYNGGALDSVATINSTATSWGEGPPLPEATYACGVSSNGKDVYVAGGFNSDDTPIPSLQILSFM